MVNHCMELVDVSTMITQVPRIEGKRNKRYKTLESRQKELLSKIEELNKTMPHSLDKGIQ